MTRKLLIDGKWLDAASGDTEPIINPATGAPVDNVARGGREDARAAIDAARRSFEKGGWSEALPGERARVLLKMADLLEARTPELARLESLNQGKTIRLSRDGDLPFAVDNLRFFAGAARSLQAPASGQYWPVSTSLLRREPIGVVASIAPWNYPLMIAVWKVAPALAAGNSVVLKPASLTPLTALELGRIGLEAGLPPGVLNVVTGPGDEVGDELARHAEVDLVALTGGTDAGAKVMVAASKTVKRLHLELGGKAPFIVFDDADLEAATSGAAVGAWWNGGQDCTQACRFIVHETVHDQFLERFVEKTRRFRLGDPLEETTDLGPLVSASHLKKVAGYAELGPEEGASVALRGGPTMGPGGREGAYFSPVILADCTQDMRVVQEEIFGPVVTVQRFSEESEAIEMANDVVQGLYSSVWTRDVARAHRVSNRLAFGTVCVNDHLPLASELPHGGFKQSGFGKDLSSTSLEEYTRLKHVFIDLSDEPNKPWHKIALAGGPESK